MIFNLVYNTIVFKPTFTFQHFKTNIVIISSISISVAASCYLSSNFNLFWYFPLISHSLKTIWAPSTVRVRQSVGWNIADGVYKTKQHQEKNSKTWKEKNIIRVLFLSHWCAFKLLLWVFLVWRWRPPFKFI